MKTTDGNIKHYKNFNFQRAGAMIENDKGFPIMTMKMGGIDKIILSSRPRYSFVAKSEEESVLSFEAVSPPTVMRVGERFQLIVSEEVLRKNPNTFSSKFWSDFKPDQELRATLNMLDEAKQNISKLDFTLKTKTNLKDLPVANGKLTLEFLLGAKDGCFTLEA